MDEKQLLRMKELVTEGLEYVRLRQLTETELQKAQKCVADTIPQLTAIESKLKAIQIELKAFGFHDIGHARGELAKTNDHI